MIKLADVKVNEDFEFYAMIDTLQKRFNQNNVTYYNISVSDGDASAEGKVWKCSVVESIDAKVGHVYHFIGHAGEYQGKLQLVVNNIKEVDSNEVDLAHFIKSAPISKDELINNIKGYIKKIKNQKLLNLVVECLAKVKTKFFDYPAAMSMHHNYLCGLAYHTYSMCRLADTMLEIYPGMNADLLYAGVLLHDIGKTEELSAPMSPIYTTDGNLLGHIVIGIQMVTVEATKLGIENSEEAKMIYHLLASHHGELEYGSPKEPMIMEAYALHLIDLTDSKMAAVSPEVNKTNKGEYTQAITSLNRKSLYVPNIKAEE